MPTEREKMLAGELYDAYDPELVLARRHCRNLLRAYNTSRDEEQFERLNILRELFGRAGDGLWVEPPFYCDYGTNIHAGKKVYFNFDCVVLDVAEVRIGDHVMFGPAVQIYTATHPLDALERRVKEFAKPVAIGSDVWVGGGAILLPGVRVGDRAVIGAGSVVTRDVPAGVVVAGNPARVVRQIPG